MAMSVLEIDRAIKEKEATGKPGYICDGSGLYVQISKLGTKSWVFRYRSRITGKLKEMGFGAYEGGKNGNIKSARERAAAARDQLANGLDPLEQKQQTREAMRLSFAKRKSFKECAEAYLKAHRAKLKNEKYADQIESQFETYVYPIIGATSVAAIDVAQVREVLDPIWEKKNDTASKVLQKIRAVLDYAKVMKFRSGDNPAAWQGNLSHVLASAADIRARTRKPQPALPYTQMSGFIEDLRTRVSVSARCLDFLILTNVRSGVAINAEWSEIDEDRALWVIPAEKMKADREHVVPLTPRALEILKAQKGQSKRFVFPAPSGDEAMSDAALNKLIKDMNEKRERDELSKWVDPKQDNRRIVPHGFRSAFRDWAGETTAFPREVIEHAMAHQLPDKAEAAYARGTLLDKRRHLMEAWAKYCVTPPNRSASVTQLHGAA